MVVLKYGDVRVGGVWRYSECVWWCAREWDGDCCGECSEAGDLSG